MYSHYNLDFLEMTLNVECCYSCHYLFTSYIANHFLTFANFTLFIPTGFPKNCSINLSLKVNCLLKESNLL